MFSTSHQIRRPMNSIMKSHIAFVGVALLCLLTPQVLEAQSNRLALSIELNKHTYLKSEAAFLAVTLANLGETPLKVRWPYLAYDYFEIYIKDATGKEYPYFGKRKDATDSVFSVTLAPGDSESQVLDLLPLFGKGILTLRQDHTRTGFPPGDYTIQAGYIINKNTIYSQILSFVVAEPTGREEAALQLLVQASGAELDRKNDEAVGALDALIKKYPKSAYHVQALLQKMNLYQRTAADPRKAYDAANALIQAHPTSDAAIPALSFMLVQGEKLGRKEKDDKKLLSTLIKRYPNTMLSRWATKALEHMPARGKK